MSHEHTSWIEIDGQRFEIDAADLVLYHCRWSAADWNLTLHRGGPLYLSGTVEPAPRAVADLHGARLRVELRDIDDCFAQLLGAMITHYPIIDGEVCAPVSFAAKLTAAGLLLTASYEFDWDRALDDEVNPAKSRSARFQILARVLDLHADDLE